MNRQMKVFAFTVSIMTIWGPKDSKMLSCFYVISSHWSVTFANIEMSI
jgi:hypothetical protein